MAADIRSTKLVLTGLGLLKNSDNGHQCSFKQSTDDGNCGYIHPVASDNSGRVCMALLVYLLAWFCD